MHDMTTYEGRRAYIEQCQREIDAACAAERNSRMRHEQRCALLQIIIDAYIDELNKPWRELAADIRGMA